MAWREAFEPLGELRVVLGTELDDHDAGGRSLRIRWWKLKDIIQETGERNFHRNLQEIFGSVVGTATDTVCNTVGVPPMEIVLVENLSPQAGAGSF